MGKKHYSDAIDCYTRAINQKALSDSENSAIYANRAHVNLLLGNYRRAITDAEEAIKLCPTNVKVLVFVIIFWPGMHNLKMKVSPGAIVVIYQSNIYVD